MTVATRTRRLRLLRLDARCPECGAPPASRLPVQERVRYAGDRPDRVLWWTKCRASGCGQLYPITAAAVQRAV